MLTIILKDNGDYNLKKKTLQNLDLQSQKGYQLKIYSDEYWKSILQNISSKEDDYYIFLRSGDILLPDAIKRIENMIMKYHADWYYGDEGIRNFKGNGEIFEKKAKPDFGIWGFVSCLYTGCAVIFSGKILKKIFHKVLESNQRYQIFLLRMTIEAAKISDGYHIEELLLMREKVMDVTKEEGEKINKWLNELLLIKKIPFMAVTDVKEKFCRLYRTGVERNRCTLIVITEDPAKDLYWKHMYENSLGERQVIISSKGKTFGSKCNQGAEKADGEILFFVRAGWQIPTKYKMNELEGFASAMNVGVVSPRLIDSAGKPVYTGAARVGKGFCSSLQYMDSECGGYSKGVREISVPAWQFFVIRKKLWQQVKYFSEEEISPDFCVSDFSCRLENIGYTGLYCGQIVVYSGEENERNEEQKGFLYMLKQQRNFWGRDPYFTKNMCKKILNESKQNVQLFLPEKMWENAGNGRTILILSHELSMTGAPIVLLYAVSVLREAGYQPLILCPEDGVLKEKFLDKQIPVLIDEEIYNNNRWLSYAKEFDLIFVNTIVPFLCIEQLKDSNIPVIWWIHDAKEGYEMYLNGVLAKKIGNYVKIYCVSDYAKKVLLTFRPQYSSDILLYGLPDLSKLARGKLQLENPERRKIFLTVGTLESRKGQDVLLEAIEKMHEEEKKRSIFYFIGAAKTKSVLEKLEISIQKYPETVRWIPFLDRNEIMDAYAQATAVICCSRDDPMPVFMAETMMMSGICICSENTGMSTLIHHGENGFLYRNNSAGELAQNITYVLRNSDRLDYIRRAARATYEKEFTLSAFKERLLSIMEKNLKKSEKID